MTQLIASIILLYAVVGSVGFWAVRRQRELRNHQMAETSGLSSTTSRTPNRTR